MLTPIFYVVLLTACDEKNTLQCDPSPVPNGQARLQLDGEEENYETSWLMTGSSLQINLESQTTGAMITIRLNQTDDGTPTDAITEYPASFALGDPEIGSATVYFADLTSSATTDTDTLGNFEITNWDQHLSACFSFSVYDQEEIRYDVDSGLMNATESALNQ
jgi:hypothetical protein